MPTAVYRLPSGEVLTAKDEVVTFVARNLEPLRGYHIFMRALPRIMAERPNARICDWRLRYLLRRGAARERTWHSLFLDEVAGRIDHKKGAFCRPPSYRDYLRALQVSTAHVYLTYPFVLSWSLLEAMSAGCLVIGSDTAPVRDVLTDDNGVLVPFFDVDQLADRVIEAVANRGRFQRRRRAARQTIIDNYDLERTCLPAWVDFVRGHMRSSRSPPHGNRLPSCFD